ncbi:MAG: hypothetical protein EAX95_03830 [Candidatus Thorarchaeota archaeon]|nr:hypothetical protein [Candidatus Thorarchaeota archaeon]
MQKEIVYKESSIRMSMIGELIAIAFGVLLCLYIFMRISEGPRQSPEKAHVKPTSSGKLYYSKIHDSAFFDGASEDYSEAYNRTRQVGGA